MANGHHICCTQLELGSVWKCASVVDGVLADGLLEFVGDELTLRILGGCELSLGIEGSHDDRHDRSNDSHYEQELDEGEGAVSTPTIDHSGRIAIS